MTNLDLTTARNHAITRLEHAAREADQRSHDRYWANGPHNVQRWVHSAFQDALRIVRATEPEAGESTRAYLSRLAGAVCEIRGDGPDADDEAWYAGAIDQAIEIILMDLEPLAR